MTRRMQVVVGRRMSRCHSSRCVSALSLFASIDRELSWRSLLAMRLRDGTRRLRRDKRCVRSDCLYFPSFS